MQFSRGLVGLIFGLGLPVCIGGSIHSTAATMANVDAVVEVPSQLALGKQLYEAGRYAEAVAVWQQIQSRDVLHQAQSLTFLARAYQALGDWEKAQAALDRSLALLHNQEQLDKSGLIVLAQTLSTQGSLYLTMGNATAALDTWQQSENTYRQANDPQGELGSKIDRAQALYTLGLYQRAKRLLEDVQGQLQTQADTSIKAIGLRSLGMVWQASGDLETAKTWLEQSLAISQQVGDPPEAIAATLSQLGNVTRTVDAEKALKYYDRAIAQTTDPLTRVRTQLNQLKLLTTTIPRDRQTPLSPPISKLVEAISRQLDGLPPSRRAIDARVNFAHTLMSLEDSPGNRIGDSQLPTFTNLHIAQILATARQQAQELRDPQAESYAVGMLGQLYERAHQWQEARTLTDTALWLAQASQSDEITYLWQWQLGRIWQQQGDRSQARAAYIEAVSTLTKLRNELAIDPDLQVAYQQQIEPVYRQALELLLQPGDRGAPPSQSDLKQARQTFESLQLAEIDNFFRQACLNVRPRQIDEIDPTAAVFHTILLQNRIAVILSVPGQPLQYYQTELPPAQIHHVLAQLRQSFNRVVPNSIRQQYSQQVYDWLVRPAESHLVEYDIKTLVFVADGELRNFPMAALYDGQQYLIETYAVANNSGLQLLEPYTVDDRSSRSRKILGAGLTEARQGFSSLPGVKLELEEIAQILPARIVLDSDFTEFNLQTQVDRFSLPIVHLATHGNFGSTPEDTFILTWDEKIDAKELEILLENRDNQNSVPIELLVLSACQTASGDRKAILGLAGIAVRSGAHSTLASLWRVQDRSTAELMVAFYQAFSQPGVNKAEALRQAQLHLLQNPEYAHPFFWSAFILVGNWL